MANSQALALKTEGNVFFNEKKFGEALACYQKAIAIDNEISAIWLNLSLTFFQLEKLDEALDAINSALQIDSGYLKAWFHKGKIFSSKKQYYEAAMCYQQALKINSRQSTASEAYQRCRDQAKAAIFYYVVDLKFTENEQLKILEFGQGFHSGTSGYDALFGYEKLPGFFLKNQIEQTLRKIHKSVFINSLPGAPWSRNDAGLNSFLGVLEKKQHDDFWRLDYFSAIYAGINTKPVPDNVLVLDDGAEISTILDDKVLTQLSLPPEAQVYRPAVLILPRKYTPQLAQQICQVITSDFVVLKIGDSEEGKGVLTIPREKLDVALRFLFARDKNHFIQLMQPLLENDRFFKQKRSLDFESFKKLFSGKLDAKLKNTYGVSIECYDAWFNSSNPLFLAESYEPSKPIKKGSAHYDATMRVLFLIIKDQGRYSFQPIGAYWKLPELPMANQKEPPCEDHRLRQISAVNKGAEFSLEVDLPTLHKVYAHLNLILPIIFKAIHETNYLDLINTHLLPAAKQTQECYFLYQMKLANSAGGLGRYAQAISILETVQKKQPDDYRSYHELAIIYHLQGDDKKAIESYTKCLALDPCFTAAYRRRAESWLALNCSDKAQQDIKAALKLNSNDKQSRWIEVQIQLKNQVSESEATTSYHCN